MASAPTTSPENIQQQHDEAVQLVRGGLPYDSAKSNAEIPLSHKAQPIYKLDDDESHYYYEPYWTSRGYASVKKLQDLVREGYNLSYPSRQPNHDMTKVATSAATGKAGAKPKAQSMEIIKSKSNLWDPANASVNNVAVCRPSHDAWGIYKIILFFCDDFLQRTFVLPWWHDRADIREAIQPILTVLKITTKSVVRMLLASLPPGVTIPIHEDSGAWVAKTHRVHVPIIVEHVDEILFRCGPTDNTMERIITTPGHVFEMNNQAKHAVSNCSSDHRVHLILDYIGSDDGAITSLPPMIKLDPGEILVQTRRSVDRWKERGSRPTPSFLILGAQKAGTTSLYEYMVQHPLIVKAKRRETHCLDWRWNTKLKTPSQQRKWCQLFYETDKLYRNPSCLTGDSTPSYLIDSRRVIPRIQTVFPWSVKFLVMLRNPIHRAESHYAMVTSTDGTPEQLQARGSEWRDKSFRQVVMEDLQNMQKCGLIPYWDIEMGTLDGKLFQSFSGSEREDMAWNNYLQEIPLNTGSHSLLSRGLYELNLRPWLRAFPKTNFLILQLEQFQPQQPGGGVSLVMEKVWQHVGVPSYEIEDVGPKNTREYNSHLDDSLRSYLERFYQPHNQRLAEILGHDDWKGIWCNKDAAQNEDEVEERENFPHQS